MKLLTLLILAPMVAGAQIKDTLPITPGSGITLELYTKDGLILADTSYRMVTDTIPVQMLVVDTCNPYTVTWKRGYMVMIGRLYSGGLRLSPWYDSRHFINDRKRRMPLCYYVWEARQ